MLKQPTTEIIKQHIIINLVSYLHHNAIPINGQQHSLTFLF